MGPWSNNIGSKFGFPFPKIGKQLKAHSIIFKEVIKENVR